MKNYYAMLEIPFGSTSMQIQRAMMRAAEKQMLSLQDLEEIKQVFMNIAEKAKYDELYKQAFPQEVAQAEQVAAEAAALASSQRAATQRQSHSNQFVSQNLGRGDDVVYKAQVSWWSQWHLILLGLATLWFFVGFGFLIIAALRIYSTELYLTRHKVFIKTGIIQRDSAEIRLNKVESVTFSQSIAGRICNFGTIVVSGTGSGSVYIHGIKDPVLFKRHIDDLLDDLGF